MPPSPCRCGLNLVCSLGKQKALGRKGICSAAAIGGDSARKSKEGKVPEEPRRLWDGDSGSWITFGLVVRVSVYSPDDYRKEGSSDGSAKAPVKQLVTE